MKNKKTKHSVYNLNYHIVLVTKYRRQVLHGEIEEIVKKRIGEICKEYEWELIALEVMPDHIHLFVSAPPKIAPLTIASTIKSIVAVDTFKNIWALKKFNFWGSGLFSRGTYYGSAGTVSSETIKKYIAEQKTKDEEF
jgi:putative transposase